MATIRVEINPGSTHIIHLDGLRDNKVAIETGGVEWINDATVSLESILDQDDTPISPEIMPLPGDYVTESNGDYIIPVPASIPFVIGDIYTFEVKAEVSGGGEKLWYPRARAAYAR